MEAAQLELTYILTSQLDAQRDHYERRLAQIQCDHAEECERLRLRANEAEAEAARLKQQLAALTKQNKAQDRKLAQLTNKVQALQGELAEERGLGAALAATHAEWHAAAKRAEQDFMQQISELKEQLRDVMFFVEARGQLAACDAAPEELQAASVSVAPPPRARQRRSNRHERT